MRGKVGRDGSKKSKSILAPPRGVRLKSRPTLFARQDTLAWDKSSKAGQNYHP